LYCRLAAADGLETTIFRLANVYGPRDRDRVIPLFLEAACAGSPLTVYGGNQVLDFVWIDAVVEALRKAAFGPWLREPLNLGSGQGTTVLELARHIVELAASPAPINVIPSRQIEVSRFVADITRARQLLEWKAPGDPLQYLPHLAPLSQAAPLPRA
jgi:UDP-glucose 4-epimerase